MKNQKGIPFVVPSLKQQIQDIVTHYQVDYGEITIRIVSGKWKFMEIKERINADEMGSSGKQVLHLQEFKDHHTPSYKSRIVQPNEESGV